MHAFNLGVENEDEELDDDMIWQDDATLQKILRDEWFEENPDKKVFVGAQMNTKRY